MSSILSSLLHRVFALGLILLFSPIFILVGIMIFFCDGYKPIFVQQRAGLFGKPFSIFKFRTMKEGSVTKLGTFIRKWHLDEIPQLFNILQGAMAFVGPRPLLLDYLDQYTDHEQQRHSVLPGITGLAQIRGGNYLRWEHQFKYDVFYVRKKAIIFDFLILLGTIHYILSNREKGGMPVRKWNRVSDEQT